MFDDHRESAAGFGSTRKGSAMERLYTGHSDGARRKKPGKNAETERRELHGRLMSFYERELARQGENRAEQARDEDFYDNDQWSEEDKQQLRERGQMPLVYNVIATAVNWVVGTEKRGRTDYKVLPRRKDASKPAERKRQLFKYYADVNRSQFHVSRAFEDTVKVGIGWVETGVQDEDDGEPIYERYESWRNVLWDTSATELDLSDARYLFRSRWVDLDVALALFPDSKHELTRCAEEGDRYRTDGDLRYGDEAMDAHEDALDEDAIGLDASDHTRQRVRLIECWFRKPIMGRRLKGGDFSGEVFDSASVGHVEQLQAGKAAVVQKVMMRMHVAIMTTADMLYLDESPYRHNQFHLTPIWCYRRGRDGMPYGLIRGLRGIQEDINKRASKALAILSSNKTIMEKGAVDDVDAYLEEVAQPDAVIIKNKGYSLEINADRDLAPAHLELMARSIQMVQQVSGVTDEAMGRTTNATSGVAIGRRQEQAGMSTAGVFDNLRLAIQVRGERLLSLIEQYVSERKAFRITNMRGTPEFIEVNDGLPENDIVRTKADFIISEEDWRASVRQSQLAELMDLLAKLAPVAPQAALVTLDLIVEAMDISSRDELVKRIRAVTGQRDPDVEEPTPEEIAQQQQQQEQAELSKRAMVAKITRDEAQAEKAKADAQGVQARTQQILASIAGANVNTQRAALQAALDVLNLPGAVPVADGILHEAGFQSRGELEESERQGAMLEGQERQAQAAQEQQAAQQQQQQAAELQQKSQMNDALADANPIQREAVKQQVAQQQQQQAAQQQAGQPQPTQE